jgi:hypothetical protein
LPFSIGKEVEEQARILGRHGDQTYRCRKKEHRFELVRNLEQNIWNEKTYDLTEGFDWLEL